MAFVAFGLLLFLALPASANEAYNRMIELSSEASQAFREGNLELAATRFAQAYATFPEPLMLKNEMVVRFALDDCSKAMDLGKRFATLVIDMDAEDREDLHGVFGECGLRASEQALASDNKSMARVHLEEATPYLSGDEQLRRAQVIRDAIDPKESPLPDNRISTQPDASPGLSTTKMAGIGLAAAGGATLIGNTIWYALYRSDYNELVALGQAGTDRQRYDSLKEELDGRFQTLRWAVPTLYVVGSAATAAGVYLLFFHDDGTSGVVVLPHASPDGVGASLHLRF
jgi:hypothetical protein